MACRLKGGTLAAGTASSSRFNSQVDVRDPSTPRTNGGVNYVSERTPLLYRSLTTQSPFAEAMEKSRRARFANLADRLATDSEPGLTNAQLMLANHDLKPVEPERRQWRSRNFVAFWIADSFNIVRPLTLSQEAAGLLT
jgi:hypothetical protein